MTVKKMLINASHPEECRVAVVADGILEELDVQISTREATLGNIYKGVITRVEPSLQAAFVDYGGRRNGFLSINDVHPSYFPESFEVAGRRPRIQEVFKKDDHVIVQVNKEERENKGASLTTNISLAGRYLVLMPGTELCGVSRKIEDEKERKKLKEILKQLEPPENMGFIIRTAGMGRTKTELSRDLNYVLKLWRAIEKNVGNQNAPALLYREHDIVIRSIRDHFSPDISEILVDEKEVFKKAKDFFRQVMPKYENLVKLYQERRPLFNKYQLEEQIEQVYRKRIKLKSGGYIIIEPTEAMVTVDVNSGSAIREKGIEETAFRVNMEAAPEIARQLRMRDLGGIIVVDFIDMVQKKHKQEVEKTVRAELKKDRAKTKVLRISGLGVLELSRQRLKSSLGTGEYLECPLCNGMGKVKSPEMTALAVFRKIKSQILRDRHSALKVTVPAPVAEYLLNRMRDQLVDLEREFSTHITVVSNPTITDRNIVVETTKEEPLEPPTTESLRLEEPVLEEIEDQEPRLEVNEELQVASDLEKKHGKRSARRRRRSKRKVTPEADGDVTAPETLEDALVPVPRTMATDADLDLLEDLPDEMHVEPTYPVEDIEVPVEQEEHREPQPVVEEMATHTESGANWERLDEEGAGISPKFGLKDLLVDHSAEGAEECFQHVRVVDEASDENERPEVRESSQTDVSALPEETEDTDRQAAIVQELQNADTGQQQKKREPRRKNSLQSYLPFS